MILQEGLLRYPLLYHPHPKRSRKYGLLEAYLDLVFEMGVV